MSKSSAALIEELFQRFAGQHARRFSGEPALTKRQASRWLSERDLHVLARWTNEAAHETRRDWRVPIARVYDLCAALEATPDERDELMVARLNELMAHDRSEDIPALLHWLQPMLDEFSNRPAVMPLERQVLAAFNRAYEATELAHGCPVPFELDDQLEAKLAQWLVDAAGAHADQRRAEDAEDTPAEKAAREAAMARVKAKRRAGSAASAPSSAAAPPSTPREFGRQRKTLMREFSSGLRKEWRQTVPRPAQALPAAAAEPRPLGTIDGSEVPQAKSHPG